jgi:Flp pilus assembly protein TadG
MSTSNPTSERQRGQAFTDFALAVPLILLLALGLFDAGRAVLGYTTLANAARAGARVAIVDQSDSTVCTTIQRFKCVAAAQAVAIGLSADSIPDVIVTGSDCALTGTCTVTVSLSYDIQMITPIINDLLGPFTITAAATMPLERAYTS